MKDIAVTKELIEDVSKPADAFDRSRGSRIAGLTGLGLSLIAGFGCIFAGAALLSPAAQKHYGWLCVSLSELQRQVTPLFLNIIITLLTESIGFTHSTALRWALKEQLVFNSNLRLFTTVPRSWAFGRTSNLFGAGFLALSYCASSLLFAESPVGHLTEEFLENVTGMWGTDTSCTVLVSPSAILALGLGLTGAGAISVWQISRVHVPTWSSDPIASAWASVVTEQRSRVEGRCLMSVHEAKHGSCAQQPKAQQKAAWAASKEVRRVLIYLWLVAVFAIVFFGAIFAAVKHSYASCDHAGVCNANLGPSWSLLPDAARTSFVRIDTFTSQWGKFNPTGSVAAGLTPLFLLILIVQSVLTIGLHCAELLVNMSRDEYTWREAYTKKGFESRNSVVTVLTSPKSLLLLALKPFIHWLYGLGVTIYYGWGLFIRPPQLLYLFISVVFLASFVTWLCFAKPKGPQPATFGHIQTLVDLVDEYGNHLYWGHKSDGGGDVAHAGTAVEPLPPIIETEWYAAQY